MDLMVLDKLEESAILYFELPEGNPTVWDYQLDLAQMEPKEACREVLGFFGEEDVRSRQTAIQSANDNEEVLGEPL